MGFILLPSSLILDPGCPSVRFDHHAVIIASAFQGDEAANYVALNKLYRSLAWRTIATASTGRHAHAIASLQWTIFGFVEQLGFLFPVLEDQHLTRLRRLPALHPPGRAADAIEVRPQFAGREQDILFIESQAAAPFPRTA